jgi:hypothetical protein
MHTVTRNLAGLLLGKYPGKHSSKAKSPDFQNFTEEEGWFSENTIGAAIFASCCKCCQIAAIRMII